MALFSKGACSSFWLNKPLNKTDLPFTYCSSLSKWLQHWNYKAKSWVFTSFQPDSALRESSEYFFIREKMYISLTLNCILVHYSLYLFGMVSIGFSLPQFFFFLQIHSIYHLASTSFINCYVFILISLHFCHYIHYITIITIRFHCSNLAVFSVFTPLNLFLYFLLCFLLPGASFHAILYFPGIKWDKLLTSRKLWSKNIFF